MIRSLPAALLGLLIATPSLAQQLPPHKDLKQALQQVVKEQNGGFGLDMWATVVDRDGVVRTVAYSGEQRGDQWPGSRVISAQKANTANAFSLPKLGISTANLYAAVQPGGPLYGLQHSNPVDVDVAYDGEPKDFGTSSDPMVGEAIGGINVFGGGLPLYAEGGELVGALGVSGDSSCADHNIAWKVRDKLGLDNLPKGVNPDGNDNIVYDIKDGRSVSGWGHPECSPEATKIAKELPKSFPLGGSGEAKASQ